MTRFLSVRPRLWAGPVALACLLQWPSADVALSAEGKTSSPQTYRQLLDRYCVGCHNDQTRSGELSLEAINLESVGKQAEDVEVWEKVIRKLNARAMPPPGSPRPDDETYNQFVSRLETGIDREAELNPGRRPAVHRLNRAEYANAIRDLFHLEIDPAELLPADDSGYGFDNIADVLSVSPMLTERYLAAAHKISRLAVGDPSIQPATTAFDVDKYLRQDGRVSDELPFGSRGGIAVRHFFPADGEYVVKIQLLRTYDGRVRGLLEPSELEVRLDGALIETLTVGPPSKMYGKPGAALTPDFRNVPDDGQEVRFTAKAGPRLLGVSFVDSGLAPEGMRRPHYPVTSYEYAGDQTVQPGIANIELQGPYKVTGLGDTPSRRRIFVCRPPNEQEESSCADVILSTVARRAYRRPLTGDDRQVLAEFFESGRRSGGFEAGVAMGLRRILMSPDFLFRRERDPDEIPARGVYPISDLELASRLSFFLWSSIPDDELLEAAEGGVLRDPEVLERQVARMLADERSRSLVDNFGGQWLYLRNMGLVSPDPYAFKHFDANLRGAMQREMELFLDSQIREDAPVPELLTAEYTFVNERLARHYGIPNIYGNHFRRVSLAGEHDPRRGLLGKASLLTVTSYAHRTSPVLRGKWLLENILGSPPPPPPADVPALEENSGHEEARSVRERLEQHRANPVCASCHQIMDPLGFALENFDGIGRWRLTGDGGNPIDAAGTLTDGRRVDGPASLRKALVERPEQFVTTVTEKLLTYALGRGVEYYDAPAVRRIVREAGADGYRWSAIVSGIVRSTPFQMRRMGDPRPGPRAGRRR